MTMIYSRHDLQNDASAAVRATESGPVIITENGSSAYVLLSIDAYRQLLDTSKASEHVEPSHSLYDALLMPDSARVDPNFEFSEMKDKWSTGASRP